MGNEEVLPSLPLKSLNSLQTVLLLGGGVICPVLHTRVLLRNIPPEGYGSGLMFLLVLQTDLHRNHIHLGSNLSMTLLHLLVSSSQDSLSPSGLAVYNIYISLYPCLWLWGLP